MSFSRALCPSLFVVSILSAAFTTSTASALEIQKTVRNVDEVTLTVTPSQKSLVDFLIVVDDSASMSPHQLNLANGAKSFAQELKNSFASAHVAVTTTSMDCMMGTAQCGGHFIGDKQKVLDPSSPDFVQNFITNLTVGEYGSGQEMPFAATIAALSSPNLETTNAGFLRPSAHLAVIFVTDAEDQSLQSPQDLIQFLQTTKGAAGFSLNAFLAMGPSCEHDEPGVEPVRIQAAVAAAQGQAYSICEPDYAPALSSIASHLGLTMDHTIALPYQPVFSSIQVTYGSIELVAGDLQQGWVYDSKNNSIILGSDIDWLSMPLADLKVHFKVK